jgi:hypothetical protein
VNLTQLRIFLTLERNNENQGLIKGLAFNDARINEDDRKNSAPSPQFAFYRYGDYNKAENLS